jgi:hypothetical protein
LCERADGHVKNLGELKAVFDYARPQGAAQERPGAGPTVQTQVKGLVTQVNGEAMLMAKGGITMIG